MLILALHVPTVSWLQLAMCAWKMIDVVPDTITSIMMMMMMMMMILRLSLPAFLRPKQLLHIGRSSAGCSTSSHAISISCRSGAMVAVQFFHGRPRFHHLAANWMLVTQSSMRCTGSNHRNHFCFGMYSRLVTPVLRRTSFFVTLPFQLIPNSFLNIHSVHLLLLSSARFLPHIVMLKVLAMHIIGFLSWHLMICFSKY